MRKYPLHNRPDRELTSDDSITEILKSGKFAVISMCRNNEPYIVSLSYGYDANMETLYFHCAKEGLKLDFISANPNVCATIIDDGGYLPDQCAHQYKSVVIRGKMKMLETIDEKKHGMIVMLNHLENDSALIKEKLLKSENYYSNMEVLRLDIMDINAKAGR